MGVLQAAPCRGSSPFGCSPAPWAGSPDCHKEVSGVGSLHGTGTLADGAAVAAVAAWLAVSISTVGAQSEDPVFEAEVAPDQQIDEAVAEAIKASRVAYRGKCPCPYDRDKAGRSYGKRIAYSRTGGASVLCYPNDVQ